MPLPGIMETLHGFHRPTKGAGGHCRRDPRVRAAQEGRRDLQRAVPVSYREDAVVHGESGTTVLLLPWLPRGGRCAALRRTAGAAHVFRGVEDAGRAPRR